ncbi:uncharacterized protein LOC142646142 [Dermatophagoides pteronyssinus]|uniref:uncharacterized protein LOC142646142 n=1 Tax=Dermatophagoides pteronyssinus TaxID=6956 RepID=UPI003F6731D6
MFSAEKTYIMGFSKMARTINVKIGDRNLEMKDQVKYLGIVLDQQLNFKGHADHVIKKLTNLFNMFSRLVRPSWGLNPDIAGLIYRMVAEPMVLYGASIWHKAFEVKKIAQRILSVQRKILIKVCKGHRTMSYTSTFLINNVMPIDIKIKERAAVERVKLLGKEQDENINIDLEKTVPVTSLPHPGKRIIKEYLKIVDHNEINKRITNEKISIFTDGSKLNNHTGAACVVTKNQQLIDQKKWKLADHCSVFQAELLAIKMSLLQFQPESNVTVQIFSDSRSSLEAIRDCNNCHPLVIDINNRIGELKEIGTNVYLYWIKAHTNYVWNEMADQLAKAATMESFAVEEYNKMPVSTFKHEYRQKANAEWTARNTEASTGRWTVRLIPSLATAERVQSKLGMSKLLTQVLSGHGATRHYLCRFKIIEDGTCLCSSNKQQTTEHLMLECPIWENSRHCITIKHGISADDLANLDIILGNNDLAQDWISFVTTIYDGLPFINNRR